MLNALVWLMSQTARLHKLFLPPSLAHFTISTPLAVLWPNRLPCSSSNSPAHSHPWGFSLQESLAWDALHQVFPQSLLSSQQSDCLLPQTATHDALSPLTWPLHCWHLVYLSTISLDALIYHLSPTLEGSSARQRPCSVAAEHPACLAHSGHTFLCWLFNFMILHASPEA